jgi:hypothetical protein
VLVDRFREPPAFRDFFMATYGPTIAVYKNISGDASRVEALDWEYLMLTARRA